MQTPAESSESAPRIEGRADVTAVVHVDGVERVEADRIVDVARAWAHGPVDIATTHDAAAARLTLTASGRLPAVLRLLNATTASGARLIADGSNATLAAHVENVGTVKAVAIGDHLLNAAKNHPLGGPPLEVRTEHDERGTRLHVTLNGSLSATSYLLSLVNLHLTQSRT
jgi:hypothetical protein